MHRRQYFKKNFTRAELNHGIDICRLCHDGIHDRFDEMQLAKDFRTFESLARDASLRKHFSWVAKQKLRR